MESEPASVIWETVDRLGRTVALTDAAWSHIRARHRDLSEAQDEIREAIALADEVFRDRTYRHRDIHYRRYGSGRLWLRVVVNYRPIELHGWTGHIITAHFTGKRSKSEVLLWPFRNRNSIWKS
jgi:hypothetical protein